MILSLENIRKTFGGLVALNDVNLTVEEGKISSLIGPNGAGKTTLFNVITGTLQPDSGKVEFKGQTITGMRPYQTARKGIIRTYQIKNLFPNLTVYENIEAGMLKEDLSGDEIEHKVRDILGFLGLTGQADQKVTDIPPLDAKLVELGRSLATNPELILLDELIGGLLHSETQEICDILEKLQEEGYTILQVAHEMAPIMKTSDWIVVLNQGAKLAEGTPEEIQNNQEVQEVYLETSGAENE